MRLADFLERESLNAKRFADANDLPRGAVYRALRGVVPVPAMVIKIYLASNGAVRPDDLYRLPQLPPWRAER